MQFDSSSRQTQATPPQVQDTSQNRQQPSPLDRRQQEQQRQPHQNEQHRQLQQQQQREQQRQQQQWPAAAATQSQRHGATADSAWSGGGDRSTASDTLLLPHPRDAEVGRA